MNGVITSLTRVITPVAHLFFVIYRGYFTPFATGKPHIVPSPETERICRP